jgi:hypothetical protein
VVSSVWVLDQRDGHHRLGSSCVPGTVLSLLYEAVSFILSQYLRNWMSPILGTRTLGLEELCHMPSVIEQVSDRAWI